MIPPDVIQRILDATNIVELIGEKIELQRAGNSYKGLCPFHNEKTPSFNVNPSRRTFKCFGCQAGGDAIRWEMEMFGIDFKEACGRLAARAGIHISDDFLPDREAQHAPRRKKIEWREPPALSTLESGSPGDQERLAALRGLRVEGIRVAVERGYVGFTSWSGKRAWVVTDKTRVNAQIRYLDGTPVVNRSGDIRKAMTLPNSWATWPLGSPDIKTRCVLVTEGGPDFLTAIDLIDAYELSSQTTAVGVLGAAMPIHPKAIPFFRGKIVHIAQHDDEAGEKMVARWVDDLAGIAHVTGIRMPDGDLNDCLLRRGPRETISLFPYRTELPF